MPANVAIFQERRDAAVAAFRAAGFACDVPRATMYLWIPLPDGIAERDVRRAAAGGGGRHRAAGLGVRRGRRRLLPHLVHPSPARIAEAAQRAGRVLRQHDAGRGRVKQLQRRVDGVLRRLGRLSRRRSPWCSRTSCVHYEIVFAASGRRCRRRQASESRTSTVAPPARRHGRNDRDADAARATEPTRRLRRAVARAHRDRAGRSAALRPAARRAASTSGTGAGGGDGRGDRHRAGPARSASRRGRASSSIRAPKTHAAADGQRGEGDDQRLQRLRRAGDRGGGAAAQPGDWTFEQRRQEVRHRRQQDLPRQVLDPDRGARRAADPRAGATRASEPSIASRRRIAARSCSTRRRSSTTTSSGRR